MYTFFKFFSVGLLNTAVDFAVLNVCVYLFGTGAHGELFVFFKAFSFLVAVTNSYFFNKYWVFEHNTKIEVKETSLFFIVSCVGLLLNVSISLLIFTLFADQTHEQIAANAGALMGTAIVFGWNFLGYRFFVFTRDHD